MTEEIRQDVRAIKTDVSDIKTILAVNTKSLEHHIARTELAEKRIEKIETWTLSLLTAMLVAAIGIILRAAF